jgi:formyl-CoA transferase
VGNGHPTHTPTGVYPSSDGHFNISGSSTRLWLRTCDVLGKPEWKEKPEWQTQDGRTPERKIINAAIAEITKTKPTAYWMEAFEEAGVPCGPIYTVDQTFADPQVQHLALAQPVVHPRLGKMDLVASPLNFSDASRALRSATPEGGEHTNEIMQELGYAHEEIERFRQTGVIM